MVTDYDLVADNIRALGAIYVASMFDQLKAFEVADRLVELFQRGVLPLGSGGAAIDRLEHWIDLRTRVSESERRAFYAETFGLPGGEPAGSANHEFSNRWLRFVSAVSDGADDRHSVPAAAGDLAKNLSSHTDERTQPFAKHLREQVEAIAHLLSDPDITIASGARDMWQVIDQVATLELGGASNSTRYRTMAESGAIIFDWLATSSRELLTGGVAPSLDLDTSLLNACNQWLAATSTSATPHMPS